ncbi:unnamed protein product [Pleuronectes platessa]|uniref:Uncharacterized protein n=1 Tax=Pleuronectes platessa TaxID=8262 RepID=A0A9N7YKP2_PLEPL|nr:unnamed protein product [Pleuronectes platessa]
MVAEALTRAYSSFNHPTGGCVDEEKCSSSHCTVDHQRGMRHLEAVRGWCFEKPQQVSRPPQEHGTPAGSEEPKRGGPPDTGAERDKGLLNFWRENILLQAQESPPGGGKMFWECLGTELSSKPRPLRSIPDKSIGRCPMTNSSRRRTSQDKASFCHRRDEAEFRSKSKRRIRSISGPSTKPLQQMNQRYPAQAMTSSPNSGDSLTACTPRNTTRDSLDFWKIRATRKQHREGHNR